MVGKKDWFVPFSWCMVALSFVLSLVVNPILGNPGPSLIFMFALPLVLVHGIRRYGWKGMGFFVVATYVISTFWEALSIHTGFPFGHYHYTMYPQILGVGFMIGPAYISLGYISWQVANAIFQEADTRISRASSAVIVSALSAVVMTVYDLATDATASTIGHAWIWERGGAFFGVPVSNFLGWWFCTFSFYVVFALFLNRNAALVKKETSKIPILQFILIYANLGMTVVITALLRIAGTGEVRDAIDAIWKIDDMIGSQLLWAVFGMFALVFLAAVNLYRIGLPKESNPSN